MHNEVEGVIFISDFDDVVARRGPVTRLIGVLASNLKHGQKSNGELSTIPENISHEGIGEEFTGPADFLSYLLHRNRRVFSESRGVFEENLMHGGLNFIATGRSNRWAHMTERTLMEGRMRHLVHKIAYTPDGTRTAESKSHFIQYMFRQYPDNIIKFRDDDPRTIVEVAQRFPKLMVEYVEHPITRLLIPKGGFTQPNINTVTVGSSVVVSR